MEEAGDQLPQPTVPK